MDDGFIKLHRQIFDSYQFCNPVTLKIWIWILLKANHKQKFVPLKIGKGYIEVKVCRGQFIFGRNKAEDELNIDGSTIYRNLKKFEDEKAIIVESNNQYSLITICNYDTYNNNIKEDEQPMNNQRTSNEQPTNTNKNEKNINKVINVDFEVFWNAYDKKVSLEKSKIKWASLTDIDRELIMKFIPKYKQHQPDKKFRKDPMTFMNNKSWNDELFSIQQQEEKNLESHHYASMFSQP